MCNHYNNAIKGGFYVCAECGEVNDRQIVPGICIGYDESRPEFDHNFQRQYVASIHNTLFYPRQASGGNYYLFRRLRTIEIYIAGSYHYHALNLLLRACKKFEIGIDLQDECTQRFRRITSRHQIKNMTVFGAAIFYETVKNHGLGVSMDDIVATYQEQLVHISKSLLFKKMHEYSEFFRPVKADLVRMVSANIEKVIEHCKATDRLERKAHTSRRHVFVNLNQVRILANTVASKLVPLVDGKFGCRPTLLAAACTYGCFVMVQDKLNLPYLVPMRMLAQVMKMDEHSIRDIWTAHLLKYRPKNPNMQYVHT